MLFKLCFVVVCVLDADALMTSRDFHRLVAPACLKHEAEDKDTFPMKMKTFTELIVKVEKLHQLNDAADTASLLLRRFSMSYMRLKKTHNGYMFLVDKAEEARTTIFEVLLRSVPRVAFKEDSFTSVEKCALFFMLSHSIEQRNSADGTLSFVENGVVSPIVDPEGHSALALSAVLKGIAASKYASRQSTETLLAVLRPYSGIVAEGHTVIDHLYGPTLAGLLGTSVLWRNTTVVPQIGRSGTWTSPLCPREFKVSPKIADITDAEISGTIDGFILNIITSRISKQRQRPFSLSQLMSTYYSSHGIHELIPEFSNGVSFCNRAEVFRKLFSTERLTEQTLAVGRLFNAAEALPLKEVIETYAIVPTVKKFAQQLENFVTHPPSTCQEIQRVAGKGTCQTQSNVLLLLDPLTGSSKFDNYQRKLSAYLSEKLLDNNPDSRVSMSSSSLAENPHVLKLFFSSSYKQKNPSCQAIRPDTGCLDCQEADIWRAVNGTWNSLLEDDVEMAAGTVTPSKVVVYFKFNDFKSNEEDLQNVIRGLRKSHKDLYIFVVGPKPEILEKFRADIKDAVVIIPQAADERVMQRIASELAHEICQTPAIVHCENCLTDHLQVSSVHQTFLAPQSSYSWAIHPDELKRKPFLVNITVSSDNLPLKICFERQNSTYQRVPVEETNCHETSPNGVFEKSFADLCDDTNCDMMHFKILALPRKAGVAFNECNHPQCRFPDETRVEIAYVAEFEDDLVQTSNRLNTFRQPVKIINGSRSIATLQSQSHSSPSGRQSSKLDGSVTRSHFNQQAHPIRSTDERSDKLFEGHREEKSSFRKAAEVDHEFMSSLAPGTKTGSKSYGNEPGAEYDNVKTDHDQYRLEQKHRPKVVIALDQSQTAADFLGRRPDIPYENSSENLNERKVVRKQSSEKLSLPTLFKDERSNAGAYFGHGWHHHHHHQHHHHRSSKLGDGSTLLNENLQNAFRQQTKNNFVTSETSERYSEQSSNKRTFNPSLFDPDAKQVNKLRPIDTAEICALSKQKTFLLALDQFLFILEKLEKANPLATIVQVAEFLLDKYVLDSPSRVNRSAAQGDVFRSVQRALIGDPLLKRKVHVDDDALLPSEKCHLFHLLSYDKQNGIERGVVALDFDEEIAVALGPVLLGVVGSPLLVGQSFRTVSRLAKSLNHAAEVETTPDSRVTIVDALTFGAVLLPETISNPRADLVDSSNSWQDAFCPYNFVRHPTSGDEVESWITYSRVRGAIDGYILGTHSNVSAASSLRDLLYGYYSARGVARAPTSEVRVPSTDYYYGLISVCSRYDLFPSDLLTLETEFLNFYRAFAAAYPGLVVGLTEARVTDVASRVLKKIMRATEHKLLSMPSFCDDGPAVSLTNPVIETPAEIHLILKTEDIRFMAVEEMQRYWSHQKFFVSLLSRQLNLGSDRKVFLQMNQQSIQNGHLMQIGVKGPGLPSSVTCQTQKTFKIDRMKDYAPQNEATVLEALHQKLLNATNADGKVKPSRIVVWMAHGSEQRSPSGVIERAVESLKKDFQGTVAFFAVTTTQKLNVGKNLFSVKFWDENTNKGALSIRNQARDLARESFLAPAIPTCLNCGEGPARITFEENVSQNGVKVYKFTLNEFPQMSKGQLSVTSLNGILTVCYERNNALTISGWNRCTQIADNVIAFRPNCKEISDCEPIYVAIFGIRETCEQSSCTGKIDYVLDYDEQTTGRRLLQKTADQV